MSSSEAKPEQKATKDAEISCGLSHKGLNISIRPWVEGDQGSLQLHANNPNVAKNLRNVFPSPYTEQDADWWVKFNVADAYPKKFLAIVVDGKAVGGVSITPSDPTEIEQHSAELGYWLGEEYWSQGIMTGVVREFLKYVWANFPIIKRVWAKVISTNEGSRRVLEKSGLTFEGKQRKCYLKQGHLRDGLLFAILHPDVEAEAESS